MSGSDDDIVILDDTSIETEKTDPILSLASFGTISKTSEREMLSEYDCRNDKVPLKASNEHMEVSQVSEKDIVEENKEDGESILQEGSLKDGARLENDITDLQKPIEALKITPKSQSIIEDVGEKNSQSAFDEASTDSDLNDIIILPTPHGEIIEIDDEMEDEQFETNTPNSDVVEQTETPKTDETASNKTCYLEENQNKTENASMEVIEIDDEDDAKEPANSLEINKDAKEQDKQKPSDDSKDTATTDENNCSSLTNVVEESNEEQIALETKKSNDETRTKKLDENEDLLKETETCISRSSIDDNVELQRSVNVECNVENQKDETEYNHEDFSKKTQLSKSSSLVEDNIEFQQSVSVECDVEISKDGNENHEMPSLKKDPPNEIQKRECLNYECQRDCKDFFIAPNFVLSYFKVSKKKKKSQYACNNCYDKALESYQNLCSLLKAKQPLFLTDIKRSQEFVEIIDSSDEEEYVAGEKSKDDKAEFSKSDITLLESELSGVMRKVFEDVGVQNQLTWTKTILSHRLNTLEEETKCMDEQLRYLQKKADDMHINLYMCPKIKIRQLSALDLNSGRPYVPDSDIYQIPPVGEIHRPPIMLNENYYAVKTKAIASWVPCKVIEEADCSLFGQKFVKNYKIKFLTYKFPMFKTVSVKHMAYPEAPKVRLPVGSRVIAYFDATSLSRGKEKMLTQSAFYPGIIAEPLKPNNKFRYLIFYDDGYFQYVNPKDVRLVCNVSENVWEDVHPGARDFIQTYLTQYSINRPMVQTQKGQSMTTELNGKWIYARVVDIDCSLIQMLFEGPQARSEWIYRGSMRLGPVFKEYQKTMQNSAMPIFRLPRRTEPFIRYTDDEEATSNQQRQQQKQRQSSSYRSTEVRAVAKKSVSRNDIPYAHTALPVRHLNNSTIYLEDENKPYGKVVYYTAKRNLPPQDYRRHICNPSCLYKITYNLSSYSLLSKPLLSGWERQIYRQKIKKSVVYRGPCGKRLRNMRELHRYLRATDNCLNVENFDFNHEVNCLAEYVIENTIVQKRDISNGEEKMPIPLVNYYDNTMPPECKYSAKRIPTEGVNLNLDENFLAGCDCVDDCSDKANCACAQLTFAGAKYSHSNANIEDFGYNFKRLNEHVPSGIYECNSRCKCKSNCLNRVVQHPLQMKLQVFKTSNRGWGLRCINDVPKGSFICVYAGHLLTEAKANEGGLDAGDEYFAELDYIEVVEQMKNGYESDVDMSGDQEEDEEIYDPRVDDDEEYTGGRVYSGNKSFNTRLRAKKSKGSTDNTENDSQERQVMNFNPGADMGEENPMRQKSVRKYFGKNEACYVMDAKVTGNLGRYFNHSCQPNLFVQNVFVDTHDLRFPWVAFFSLINIRAGTELTWNYNYEVGVVPGKVLYCQCGAPNCRMRLL